MPTEHYRRALELTQRHHGRSKTFSGRFLFRYAERLKGVIDEFGCKTMLDFGCGKGIQYRNPMQDGRMLEDYLGVKVTKYDPGWPEFAAEPRGTFDVVCCTQVLGSIPITDQAWVIDRLYAFATKAVFVGERLGPVKKEIHSEMQDLMPHEWSHERWAAALAGRYSAIQTARDTAVFLRTLNGGGIKGKFERLA